MIEICEAPLCVMLPQSNVDSRMVYCDSQMCDRWIHVYCDITTRKLKRLPDLYYCPVCNPPRKKKKTLGKTQDDEDHEEDTDFII